MKINYKLWHSILWYRFFKPYRPILNNLINYIIKLTFIYLRGSICLPACLACCLMQAKTITSTKRTSKSTCFLSSPAERAAAVAASSSSEVKLFQQQQNILDTFIHTRNFSTCILMTQQSVWWCCCIGHEIWVVGVCLCDDVEFHGKCSWMDFNRVSYVSFNNETIGWLCH